MRQSHAPAGTFSRCKIKEKTFHALTKKVEIRHLSVKYHNFYGLTDYSKPFFCTFPTSSAISPKWPLNHPHTLQMTQETSRKCFKTALNRLQEKAFPLLPNHTKREDKQPTSFSNPLSRNTPFNMHRHCNSQPNRPKKPVQTVKKHKKRGFIEETQEQEAQERPMETASCLKKTCMRRNRQANTPHDLPDSQPPSRPTGIICHATLPPHGTYSAQWCTALHQPAQRSA